MIRALLLATALICLSFQAKSSHVLAGEITYRYIGDSTGVPHHYLVTTSLYRDSTGINLLPTIYVCIKSSCFGSRSVTLSQINVNTGPDKGEKINTPCKTSTGVSYRTFYRYQYQEDIILDGKCSDWVFEYETCCRNPLIDNINGPTFVLWSMLDNTLGPNSTGEFSTNGIEQACLNITDSTGLNWDLSKTNPDGDSIYYNFDFGNYTGCYWGQTIDFFNAGYSAFQPISSLGGVNVHQNGNIHFTPYKVENDIIRFGVEEWRFDTILNSSVMIGNSIREAYLMVHPNCRVDSIKPQDVQLTNSDTSGQMVLPVVACNEQQFSIELQKPFIASSVTASGSEFRLSNSLGQPIPVTAAVVDSNRIDLSLNSKLWYNDTLTLQMKAGLDGNTILNPCGPEIPAFTTEFTVVSCTTSVSELEVTLPEFSLFPNPAVNTLTVVPETAAPSEYQITDLQGSLIMKGSHSSGNFDVDISGLSEGFYLLQLNQDGSRTIKKFAKH